MVTDLFLGGGKVRVSTMVRELYQHPAGKRSFASPPTRIDCPTILRKVLSFWPELRRFLQFSKGHCGGGSQATRRSINRRKLSVRFSRVWTIVPQHGGRERSGVRYFLRLTRDDYDL